MHMRTLTLCVEWEACTNHVSPARLSMLSPWKRADILQLMANDAEARGAKAEDVLSCT